MTTDLTACVSVAYRLHHVYCLPLTKYKQVYPSLDITLPPLSKVGDLRSALFSKLQSIQDYQNLNESAKSAKSIPTHPGDFVYRPRTPRVPSDIRIYKFTGDGEAPSFPKWAYEMDDLSRGLPWNDEWKFWRVKHALGASHFEEECGNELCEEDEIGRELSARPLGVGDVDEGELWAFYNVFKPDVDESQREMEEEERDERDMIYVNVIEDEKYEELLLPSSEIPRCEDVLKAVDSLPAYQGKELVCFCMEHGIAVKEETPLSIVRYGMKYQTVSQLCVQCITNHPSGAIKCFGCVVKRWKKDGRPSYSDRHIPRIFYIQKSDTYQQIKDYLMRVFNVQDRKVDLLYLSCYSAIYSSRKEWVSIETLDQVVSKNPVEGLFFDDDDDDDDDESMSHEEYLHQPVFCLFCPSGLIPDTSKSSSSLHFSPVLFKQTTEESNFIK